MKNLITLCALTSTLLASGLANAATTTELKVTGVIRPAACTPSFTGGGVVDYGVIPPNTLSATAPTVLAEKTVPFSVTCDAATKVAVTAVDNRKTSVVAGLAAKTTYGSAIGDGVAFGLGTAAGKKIGVYTLRVIPASWTADGTSPDSLYDTSSSGTWAKSTNGLFNNAGGYRKAFAPAGTLVPGAYKVITGNFAVQAVIDQTSNLDLTSDVTLDGSATITIIYL